MAQRRMFSNKVIDTDTFLDMPSSSQLLYFHLSMRADDDGFISAPKRIIRMIGCSEDDMKILIAKSFIIPFESGVCVVRHWRVHNYIQKDRYTETMYKYEKSMLSLDSGVYDLDTECIQNVVHDGYTGKVRLGKSKVRLGKGGMGEESIPTSDEKVIKKSASSDAISSDELTSIIEAWNFLNLQRIVSIQNTRLKLLKARIKEHGLDTVLSTIEGIKESSFLKGQNNKGWTITFDWFVKPNNFIKVLEGNYMDKGTNSVQDNKNFEYEPF